jgi:4-alpha-glucanotransferase
MLSDLLRDNDIEGHDFYAVVCFLARTRSRLLTISLEDLLGVIDQPNIPGTIDEHPNWRQRLPVPLDELAAEIDVSALKFATQGRTDANV